jgi:U3 small nucleolar RNA-associated protein 18
MARITLTDKLRTAKQFVEPEIVEKPLVQVQDDTSEEEEDDGEETQEESDVEMGEEYGDDGEPEIIDEDELELERLVFGDSAGFREGLKGFTGDKAQRDEVAVDSLEDSGTGLEGLDDAEVRGF